MFRLFSNLTLDSIYVKVFASFQNLIFDSFLYNVIEESTLGLWYQFPHGPSFDLNKLNGDFKKPIVSVKFLQISCLPSNQAVGYLQK